MGFQLKPHESVGKGIKRVISRQIEKASGLLESPKDEEAIHDARVCFKRIRAVLRLARDGLGDEVYHKENVCFRDAKLLLAPVRDAEVLVDVLGLLTEDAREPDIKNNIRKISDLLTAEYHRTFERVTHDQQGIDRIILDINDARQRINHYSFEGKKEKILLGGIRKIYRKGYKAFEDASLNPTAEHLHEWRKQAKYLRYMFEVMEHRLPQKVVDYNQALTQVTDWLGDDHDLAVLDQRLKTTPPLFGGEEMVKRLSAIIQKRRKLYEKQSIGLGKRLYEYKPRQFIEHIQ